MVVRTLLPNSEMKLESALYLQASSFVIGKFLQKTRTPRQNFKGCDNLYF
jgi:hypothetical protein